ncbi:MAG: tRNA lysidine(34) synthetase TilS [Alphaproteobacteria bacterium GM7ARS4]|nr:tRNA lysidine(34) synthetase TilS [Alphaproteobacteria bacterium GM7ARS4]
MSERSYIDDGSFMRLMKPFEPFEARATIALAVSGGIDSMTMSLLMHRWGEAKTLSVVALTIDHGLRPSSAQEADKTQRWLTSKGMTSHILTETHPPILGNTQAWARTYRYRLMEAWCQRHAVTHLVTAHHQQDQVETWVIRVGRGSGVYGLGGILPVHYRHHIRVIRPLLTIDKESILATARHLGIKAHEPVCDPANKDPRFLRTRIRQHAHHLHTIGLIPAKVTKATHACRRVRDVLEKDMAQWIASSLHVSCWGYAVVKIGDLRRCHDDIAMQIVGRVLRLVSGKTYMPRLQSNKRLLESLYAYKGNAPLGHTLHGCMLQHQAQRDMLYIMREHACCSSVPLALDVGKTALWDGR